MESTLWFSLYKCVDYCPQYNVVRSECEIQWNLSKTATCGPVITGLYREVAAFTEVNCNVVVLRMLPGRLAALYHLRQVALY